MLAAFSSLPSPGAVAEGMTSGSPRPHRRRPPRRSRSPRMPKPPSPAPRRQQHQPEKAATAALSQRTHRQPRPAAHQPNLPQQQRLHVAPFRLGFDRFEHRRLLQTIATTPGRLRFARHRQILMVATPQAGRARSARRRPRVVEGRCPHHPNSHSAARSAKLHGRRVTTPLTGTTCLRCTLRRRLGPSSVVRAPDRICLSSTRSPTHVADRHHFFHTRCLSDDNGEHPGCHLGAAPIRPHLVETGQPSVHLPQPETPLPYPARPRGFEVSEQSVPWPGGAQVGVESRT